MLMCSFGGLMSMLAVLVRGLGMLLSGFVLAHIVMVGRLQVVMSSSRMVSGGHVMMFTRDVLR